MKKKYMAMLILSGMLLGVSAELWAEYTIPLNPTVPTIPGAPGTVNTDITNAMNALSIDTQSVLAKYGYTPDMTKGYANAAVFAAGNGVVIAPGDFQWVRVSLGTSAGSFSGGFDPMYYQKIDSELEGGDINGGAAWSPLVVQADVALDFLLEGLTISGRLARFSGTLPGSKPESESESSLYGALAGYTWSRNIPVAGNSLVWSGFSVQTGFLRQNMTVIFDKTIPRLTNETSVISYAGYSGYVTLDPSAHVTAETEATVIPFIVTTTLSMFSYGRLTLGARCDYASGESRVTFEGKGQTGISGTLGTLAIPGTVNYKIETEGDGPDAWHPGLMAEPGLDIGYVQLGLPVVWYVQGGFSFALAVSAAM